MRFQSIVFTSTLLVGLGLSVGCTTVSQTTQTAPQKAQKKQRIQDYYPMRVGDRRVYRIQFGKKSKPEQRTIRITKKVGQRFFDNEQGNFKIDAYGLEANQRRYLLKYPLRRGQKWLSVTGVTTVERYQIIDVNRTTTVPAGTYSKCIVVRSRQKVGPQKVLEALQYYAPNIGPVKIVTILDAGGKRRHQWSLELVAYYPGK